MIMLDLVPQQPCDDILVQLLTISDLNFHAPLSRFDFS